MKLKCLLAVQHVGALRLKGKQATVVLQQVQERKVSERKLQSSEVQ